MATKEKMMWLLSTLVRMIETKSFDQFDKIVDEHGLDLITSPDFLDYCRQLKNVPAVIFVASIAAHNSSAKNRPWMILQVYQSILAKKLNPDIAKLLPFHVIRRTVESIIDKKTIAIGKAGGRKLTGTGQDWFFCVELCMDHEQLSSALLLAENHLRTEVTPEFLLLCAKSIVTRVKVILEGDLAPESMQRWIRFVTALHRHTEPVLPRVAFELAQIVATFHHKNREYLECIAWCSRPAPEGCNPTMLQFRRAQAHSSMGEYRQSIDLLDQVFATMLAQTDEQIDAQFQNSDVKGAKARPKEFDGNAAALALTDLNALLQTADIVPFLVSGTLLGYQRNGGFLSHDKDIDVGIFAEQDIFSVVDLVLKSPTFRLLKGYIRLDRIYQLPVMHKATSICIDIFVYYDHDGQLITGVHGTFGYNQNFVFSKFGLQTVRFLDVDFAVPDDIPRNLRENYGDWEISDPYYVTHLQSPSTKDVGGEIHMMVSRLELLGGIVEGKPNKTRRVVQLLREYQTYDAAMNSQLIDKLEARFCPAPELMLADDFAIPPDAYA
jgi:hypothetical protein